MTLYQFNLLNETQQAEALWENGVHIGEREDLAHAIALYQLAISMWRFFIMKS